MSSGKEMPHFPRLKMLSVMVLCENLSTDLLLLSPHMSVLYRCHVTMVPKLENTDPQGQTVRGSQGLVSVLSIWRPSEDLKTGFNIKINHGYVMDRKCS